MRLNTALFFCSFMLCAGAFALPAEANTLPRGFLDHASPEAIYGWAYDPDAGEAPLTVHIYINGMPTVAITADQRRDDLVTAGISNTPYHGFGLEPLTFNPGTYTVDAYAINVPQGVNPKLGTKTFTVTNRVARGTLDIARHDYLSGWAYDADAATNPIWVHLYIDGKHEGSVLANKKRLDLVAAGVSPDAFHGFTWIPPSLTPGNHTFAAWAINTPVGPNPELRNSPRSVTVPSGYNGTAYIENSVIKVGANLNWGGALTHISHQGVNLVDDNDTGRLVQASLYDSNEQYADHASSSWGWNPVQGGDKYNRGNSVLAFSQTPTSLYTKSRMLQWNPDNKGGGANQSIASEALVETWITLSSSYPQLVEVRQKVLLDSGPARTGNHEVPAVFTQPPFRNLVLYQGNAPWTNGSVSKPTFAEFPNISTFTAVSERWLSWTNTDGFGLTVYAPDHPLSTNWNAYWIDRVTNYLRPGLTTTFTPNSPWEITYYLIVGNYSDARSLIYALRGQ